MWQSDIDEALICCRHLHIPMLWRQQTLAGRRAQTRGGQQQTAHHMLPAAALGFFGSGSLHVSIKRAQDGPEQHVGPEHQPLVLTLLLQEAAEDPMAPACRPMIIVEQLSWKPAYHHRKRTSAPAQTNQTCQVSSPAAHPPARLATTDGKSLQSIVAQQQGSGPGKGARRGQWPPLLYTGCF